MLNSQQQRYDGRQMKPILRETTLVVAGAWNPAILTPEWILTHALQEDISGASQVQVAIPVGLVFEFPQFKLKDLSYIARTDALVFFPTAIENISFSIVENAAKRILDQLCHTPISGIGYNFEFQDDNPEPDMLQSFASAQKDIVDIAPDGFAVASGAISTSLKNDQVVINIKQYFESGRLGIKFNFHHAVSSAEQASEVLNGNTEYECFYHNYLIAKELTQKLYGVVNDDEVD